MKRKTLFLLAVAAIALAAAPPLSTAFAAAPRPAAIQSHDDSISGDWNLTFQIQGMEVPGTLTLKLDGSTITGTVHSDHTGDGTLSNGSYVDGKLSFRMDFASHDSIDATGTLKEGKLAGEFRTEGTAGTWIATRR